MKDHHCPDHLYLDRVCAVLDCANDVESGFKTCNILQHRNLEVYDRMQGKAMFQLKRRLERVRAIQTNDALSSTDAMPEADQEVYIDTDGLCDGKPETGNRKLRARFGRKRTHNEELCVSSCGIILGRATFFGSEAPNGVRVCSHLYHYYMCMMFTQTYTDIPDETLSYSRFAAWRDLA